MKMGIADILVLLFITIGPTKPAAMYVALTKSADLDLKRKIALRTVLVSLIICAIFVVLGEGILKLLHISIPALLIAGGIILFVFALHLVLGEDKPESASGLPQAPSMGIADYPLAVPLMASPQGLVAIVTISAAMPGLPNMLTMLGLVFAVMVVNLIVLLSADKILKSIPASIMKVIMRIFGLLLCGLAVQLAILGLQRLGVLAKVVGAH
jgi:multiple antibiotic resistance protein